MFVSRWLTPVDTIDASVSDLEKRLEMEPNEVLQDAVTLYRLTHFSAPCLSTLRHLLAVGRMLRKRGLPEYEVEMRELLVMEERCEKSCCTVIRHSVTIVKTN